jgi:stalled ribosome alternative rescue factor ArfA
MCYTIITPREKEKKIMDKRMNKMDAETLQQFLAFRKRAGRVPAKKGKGSYNRRKVKKEVA